jgi:hypothetical protein
MDSLNSRELSFSGKHANDAEKLIKGQQELGQYSQEIHTQRARLDEDRFKIEEQIKELLKKKVRSVLTSYLHLIGYHYVTRF